MEKIGFYFSKCLRKILNPPAKRGSSIDKTARICSGSQINYVNMGRYSYVGHNCFLNNVIIGAFCSIADDVHIGGAAHPIHYVSSSPVFHKGKNVMGRNFSELPDTEAKQTIIGNDVWIGQGAFLKAGIEVGTGAVVGFGSVLTKNVPSYAIVAGNPAKIIRYRFDDSIIKKLLQSKWWEWSEEKLSCEAKEFDKPEKIEVID